MHLQVRGASRQELMDLIYSELSSLNAPTGARRFPTWYEMGVPAGDDES